MRLLEGEARLPNKKPSGTSKRIVSINRMTLIMIVTPLSF